MLEFVGNTDHAVPAVDGQIMLHLPHRLPTATGDSHHYLTAEQVFGHSIEIAYGESDSPIPSWKRGDGEIERRSEN